MARDPRMVPEPLMVRVVLWGGLRHLTDGVGELEMEAKTIQEVVTRLGEDFPRLKTRLNESVSIAVDGQIFRDSWFIPLQPGSEVFLMPRVVGG